MTLKERVKEDGILMRWIRTAATTVVAVFGAAGTLYGGFLWLVEPRAIEWTSNIANQAVADVRQDLSTSLETVDRLDVLVRDLESSIEKIRVQSELSLQPSWRFSDPDTSISDGRVGGVVQIQSGGFKLRDCGVPVVDLYFINGNDIFHRFEDASVITPDGRGVALPVDPSRLQTISYIARIPEGENVHPGRARGFISVTYPAGCPFVSPAIAGPLQFRITE